MGKAYSQDLRTRVHRRVPEGHSRHDVGRRFGVSASTTIRLEVRYRETGDLASRRQGRPKGQGKLAPYLGFLTEIVDSVPDITLLELAAALAPEHAVTVHQSSISRALQAAEYTYKKSLMASECDRADVRKARREWIGLRQPRMPEEPHRLTFIDETGTTAKMARPRGRAKRSERLRASAPFGHWGTQRFIAGLRCDELVAPWVLNGPMARAAFDTYVETQLAPMLQKGDVVILDNARPMPRATPAVEPVHAGRVWPIARRNVRPGRASAQSPEDAVQNSAIIRPLHAPHFRREQRLDHRLLKIRQIKPRHTRLLCFETVNHNANDLGILLMGM